jgi:hypothetical protein
VTHNCAMATLIIVTGASRGTSITCAAIFDSFYQSQTILMIQIVGFGAGIAVEFARVVRYCKFFNLYN